VEKEVRGGEREGKRGQGCKGIQKKKGDLRGCTFGEKREETGTTAEHGHYLGIEASIAGDVRERTFSGGKASGGNSLILKGGRKNEVNGSGGYFCGGRMLIGCTLFFSNSIKKRRE